LDLYNSWQQAKQTYYKTWTLHIYIQMFMKICKQKKS